MTCPLPFSQDRVPGGLWGHACPSDRATYSGVGVWPCALKAAGQDMERDQDRARGLGGHREGAQGRYLRERGEGSEQDVGLEGKPGLGYRGNTRAGRGEDPGQDVTPGGDNMERDGDTGKMLRQDGTG